MNNNQDHPDLEQVPEEAQHFIPLSSFTLNQSQLNHSTQQNIPQNSFSGSLHELPSSPQMGISRGIFGSRTIQQNSPSQNNPPQIYNQPNIPYPVSGVSTQANSLNSPIQNYQVSNYLRHSVVRAHNPFEFIDQLNYQDDEVLPPNSVVIQDQDSNINLDQITNLSIKLKRKTVQSSSLTEQTFPMLVSLAVDNLKSAKKVPIDLVCVIDHSGSMDGEKIELVKNTFNYLLEYLDESDRLSIVIFDSESSRLIPLSRMTNTNKQKILLSLRPVYARGGTDINLGMSHAFQILKQRRYNNPVTSIFLLSDGLDGRAQDAVKESITRFGISEEITINTFGFGRDHDPQLMSDIANLRDGNFYFIEKLDTVDEAFVDCLGGLISSVAQNVEIKIKPEQSDILQGVDIIKAYGDASMWTYDNSAHTYTTKMAALISGKQKDYVLEVKLPVNIKGLKGYEERIKIASAEAVINGLDNKKIVKKADLTITLLNEVEEVKNDTEEDDREVMKNFYRVKGAELMGKASKLADEGRFVEAKKILQDFKEEVENSLLKEEEFLKNLVVDVKKAIDDVTPDVYHTSGKHSVMSCTRAQMQQRSTLTMSNTYQSPAQKAMTATVQSRKMQNSNKI